MDDIELIRAKINILDLVSGYVQLKKAGRNFKGLCPFHQEKTPSFIVSQEKGIAYCFGCNQGGDIFKFMQLIENIEFGEALKILAERAGIVLSSQEKQNVAARREMRNINDLACRFYERRLEKNPNIKKYLFDRGLNKDTIYHFRLGYAPEGKDEVYRFLLKEGFMKESIIKAGLAQTKSIGGAQVLDRFRDRIMFPIFNIQGQIIAFTSRVVETENKKSKSDRPKYLNSPDTPTFNKRITLYGLNFAKNEIKKKDKVIIVEGNMDVIMSHQIGVTNVVASSGTALSEEHINILKRYTKNVAFAFDKDSAGIDATKRASKIAQKIEVNASIVSFPKGKDPDDCIKAGAVFWREAVEKDIPMMDFYFEDSFNMFDKKELGGKKKILDNLLPIIKNFPSKIDQGFFIDKLSTELRLKNDLLWQEMNRKKITFFDLPNTCINKISPSSYSREKLLLAMFFAYPEFIRHIESLFVDNADFDKTTKNIYKKMQKLYIETRCFNPDEFLGGLKEEEKEKNSLKIIELFIEEKYSSFSKTNIEREIKKLIFEINRKNCLLRQKTLIQELQTAGKDKGKLQMLLNEYNEVVKLQKMIEKK